MNIKEELYNLCVMYVKQRMQAAQQAIAEAQKAGNNDTKSSAGDKYETGREMAQQETNRNLAQLNEANKLLVALNLIRFKNQASKADAGSLVLTSNGYFYIAISAGTLVLDGKSYYAVSPSSPIGLKLSVCKPEDEFNLNGKNYLIKEII